MSMQSVLLFRIHSLANTVGLHENKGSFEHRKKKRFFVVLTFSFVQIASSNLNLQVPLITLEMFPKEAYTGNWMVAFRVVIPIYMVMALSQFITYLLILVVGEKENHIKEGLKIMGLRDSVFWLAWFIIYGVFVFFLTGVSVVLLFSLGVFQYTNYLPVFVLILLYSFSVILIGFMITPFFDNSRVRKQLIASIFSSRKLFQMKFTDGWNTRQFCCEYHVTTVLYPSVSGRYRHISIVMDCFVDLTNRFCVGNGQNSGT